MLLPHLVPPPSPLEWKLVMTPLLVPSPNTLLGLVSQSQNHVLQLFCKLSSRYLNQILYYIDGKISQYHIRSDEMWSNTWYAYATGVTREILSRPHTCIIWINTRKLLQLLNLAEGSPQTRTLSLLEDCMQLII